MISLTDLQVDYGRGPVITGISLEIRAAEFVLLAGSTGSGKSTLLGALAGLVPDFTGGTLRGSRSVTARVSAGPAVVALVQQQPANGFVAEQVDAEIRFGLRDLPVPVQQQRIDAALEAVGALHLAERRCATLSAGEVQRVAIAAAIAMEPDVLLLDEPTSALDAVAADEVLALLARLTRDLGVTVVIAEHRFDQAVQHVDRICLLDSGSGRLGPVADLVRALPAPPVVVQIADAAGLPQTPLAPRELVRAVQHELVTPTTSQRNSDDAVVIEVANATVDRAGNEVLRNVELAVRQGEICGVLGRNGAGKSTLLETIFGDLPLRRGRIRVAGRDPQRLAGNDLLRTISLLPQQPQDLLVEESVAAECASNDARRQLPAGSTGQRLQELLPDTDVRLHPRQLSEGQRTLLALAVCTAHQPAALLLDEPTRGLDQRVRQQLANDLRRLAAAGAAVLVATHDVDWAAEICDTALTLSAGEVVNTGSAREVLTAVQLTAPTAAKTFWPAKLLSVEEAVAAIRAVRS